MFFRHIPFLLLSAALLSGGCSKKPQPLVVYCSEIFVEPMERLGGHFQVMTGKKVILFQSDLPPDFEIRDREENAVSRPGQSGSSSTAVAPSTVVSSKDYVPAPEGIAPEILRLIKHSRVCIQIFNKLKMESRTEHYVILKQVVTGVSISRKSIIES